MFGDRKDSEITNKELILKKENMKLLEDLMKAEHKYKLKEQECEFETKKLKKEISELEHLINSEPEQKEPKDIKALEEEITKLKKIINDYKISDDFFLIKTLQKDIEFLKKEIAYKDELLVKYQELPDIKKMLSGIQDLKVPAIDDLKKMFDIFKDNTMVDKMSKLEIAIGNIIRAMENNRGRY